MSDPVRWGVLSTARINDKLLAGAALSDGVQMLGVASRDLERAEVYARERGIERAYGSYAALLADPDIEAVYISLPNGMHVPWSITALQAGKHVLCEKPMSGRATEVERAFDVAEHEGRLLTEAFMYRHNPQTRRLASLIAEGAIGRLRMVSASFAFRLDDAADPRLHGDLEGGGLMDVGCYCVSAIRLLCGEPLHVSGEQRLGGGGVDVAFAGALSCPDEVLAHFDCGLSHHTESLIAIGDEASLHLADPWHCRHGGIERRTADGGRETIAIETVNSYMLELDDLSAAIRGGGAPLLGRDDAVGQARTIEALYASAARRG
jgi:xylose dehydrogenase (NAD/NADP)